MTVARPHPPRPHIPRADGVPIMLTTAPWDWPDYGIDTGVLRRSFQDPWADCELCREPHCGDPCPWEEIEAKYADEVAP